jgi:2-oxoisovalerate dehydrogenase E1 component
MATYGRGTWLSLRAARKLETERDLVAQILDLRWLCPLPVQQVLEHARRAGRLLVVDDCRPNGGIGESLGAALAEQAPEVRFARVGCADCFVPIGQAAEHVTVRQLDIERAAQRLCAAGT